jgi:ribonuclease III
LSYANSGRPPHYRVVTEEVPPHNRRYVVEAVLDGQAMGRGEGRNRREAETDAARQALAALAGRDGRRPGR